VAVVDVRLPPTHTDEGLRAARAEAPGLPVLVLSQYVERLHARELLADGNGGIGYLLKDRVSDIGEFVDAVRRVAAGGTALDPTVVAKLLAPSGTNPLTGQPPVHSNGWIWSCAHRDPAVSAIHRSMIPVPPLHPG
jgi:DNA-binding NarL/FixJ family response regulator